MSNIQDTLAEREATYGSYFNQSHLSQDLKDVVRHHSNYLNLMPYHKEALEMILHKVARIVNGDPNHHDSWHDIAGYATLVADEIKCETDDEVIKKRSATRSGTTHYPTCQPPVQDEEANPMVYPRPHRRYPF